MILDGKVATPKEEWDYKMALSRAKFAEGQYQNRATHYQGREVASPAPDGGPRRSQPGGGNPEKGEKKNQAKQVVSKIFDLHGITESQINTDVDGTVTKVEKKTPATVFDDDNPFYSEARESARSSIATPPAPPAAVPTNDYFSSSGSPSGRGGGARRGLIERITPWLHPTEDRYMTEDEYYGTGQASEWKSPKPSKEIGIDIFGNLDVSHHGYETANNRGTLAITDEERAGAQSALIEQINNERMLELSQKHPELYEQVIAGEIDMPVITDPHEGKDYTTSGFDGSELHAAEQAAEEAKLENKLDDIPWAKDKGLVLDAIDTLKKEDPSGEAIKTINDFATWADTVPDEVAIKEAETYLQGLKDSPTVKQRFRKAMAIAMMAMLFGDDFTTAMNTGFGVVDDDYIAEATAAKTEAEAAAALAKTVDAEYRANVESDRRKARDFAYDMAKTQAELGVKAAKELEAEIKERSKNNYDWMDGKAKEYTDTLTDDDKDRLGVYNFGSQFDGALQYVKRIQPDVVWDLKNNVDQRKAFDTQFRKWMSDKLYGNNYGRGVPAFENYMKDAFIKTRMEGETSLAMIDTNPSVYEINEMGIDTTKIDWGAGMEATNAAYEKIKGFAEGYNERATMELLAKDYYAWQKAEPEEHKKMVRRANEQGIGGFIWYVTRHAEANSAIGTMYDPDAAELSLEAKADYAVAWLADQGITVLPKK